MKALTVAAVSALVFSASFSSAVVTSFAAEPTPSQVAPNTTLPPHPTQQSDDQGHPLHHINEDHEGGFEKVQLIFVGAAIVVAIGLAYRAGRRRRDA